MDGQFGYLIRWYNPTVDGNPGSYRLLRFDPVNGSSNWYSYPAASVPGLYRIYYFGGYTLNASCGNYKARDEIFYILLSSSGSNSVYSNISVSFSMLLPVFFLNIFIIL